MSTPAQPNPSPAGDEHAQTGDASIGFDEKLHQFWEEKRGLILALCGAILLVILVRYGWEWMQQRQAAARAEAYRSASASDDLRAFAAEHGDAALGGVAHLRLADEAYQDGRWVDALDGYRQALPSLEGTSLADRARLGMAVAKLRNGNTEEGKADLQQVADDGDAEKAIRAEAAYHLASLAVAAGASGEASRWTEQINAIDPTGLWAQRAALLRANQPAVAAPATTTDSGAAPAITFPASGGN